MLTQQRLCEVLNYDELTGIFVWKVKMNGYVKEGTIAGRINGDGYAEVALDGTLYKAHRLAWLYMTGQMPKNHIDHKDGDRANNAFSNLREATNAQNQCNRKLGRNNKSGFKGVHFFQRQKKWRAKITAGGKAIWLGYFSTAEEAAQAVKSAREKLHGEFASNGEAK